MTKKSTMITKRERSVLALVARGLTNREIADHLGIPLSRVKTLLYSACNKLSARNRIEAVFFAIRQRTISVNEVFSLPELVELTTSLGPETVESIAQLLRRKLEQERIASVEQRGTGVEKDQEIELTEAERGVLILVARGMTNQEIAERLCISTSSVKMLLHQACMKLKAPNRAQAFIVALRRKAISVHEVFSLNELEELLSTLGPETVETLAELMRRRLEQERLPLGSERVSDVQKP